MLDWMLELVQKFASLILSLLPTSPFQPLIESFGELPFLGWLNWLIPIGDIVKIGLAWLVAIGTFYLYSIVMRWIKLIGD